MPTPFEIQADHMKASIDNAVRRLSDSAPLEDNREALKTLMWNLLDDFSGMVSAGGGESMYIPDRDYLSNDIDHAFRDPIEGYEAKEGRAMRPRVYGTLDAKTQGLSTGGVL